MDGSRYSVGQMNRQKDRRKKKGGEEVGAIFLCTQLMRIKVLHEVT